MGTCLTKDKNGNGQAIEVPKNGKGIKQTKDASMIQGAQGGEENPNASNLDLIDPTKKISKDDFINIKVIGKGSFGIVYMVKKKGTQDIYAMKVLKKELVAKRNLIMKTQAEREILQQIESPFIVSLFYAFQTDSKLYFVMDFLNGGELFYHLRKDQKFSEKRACFYAAQIIEAMSCLHDAGIIYRDLKPENVLLGSDGNLKITDFGLSKQGLENADGKKTYSFCGTPEYLAPEIIQGIGHDKGCDWWSLGALIYEMLCGKPPHYSKDRKKMLRDIVETPIPMKSYFSAEAKSLLEKLLERNPNKRLGSGPNNANEIRSHAFFRDINWKDLREKKLTPPFKPTVSGPDDTRNIDKMFTSEQIKQSHSVKMTETMKNKTKFDGFTYDPDTAAAQKALQNQQS